MFQRAYICSIAVSSFARYSCQIKESCGVLQSRCEVPSDGLDIQLGGNLGRAAEFMLQTVDFFDIGSSGRKYIFAIYGRRAFMDYRAQIFGFAIDDWPSKVKRLPPR